LLLQQLLSSVNDFVKTFKPASKKPSAAWGFLSFLELRRKQLRQPHEPFLQRIRLLAAVVPRLVDAA
jgi:hypothetical protein